MEAGLYIKEDRNGKFHIASDETRQAVTVDMEHGEAVEFLAKMLTIKARSLKPEAPRLFYNRWQN